MLSAHLAFAMWALVAQDRVTMPSDNLAAAKALYAAGTYEEALSRLSSVHADRSADEADQYRALCLLALGRAPEAQQTLEDLVSRTPLVKMSESEVSPRLLTMFHDVRKRQLPGAVRSTYAKAKTSYEQKDYAAAATQLKMLLELLADDDLGGEAAGFADLKMLAEGFQKLTDANLAAASQPAAPPATAPPASATASAAEAKIPSPAPERVYTAADQDVTPPVDIARTFPEWNPPSGVLRRAELHGVIKITVDAHGKVEAASLVSPVFTGYDPLLIAAAKEWKFQPARRNGEPVKYQKLIAFSLAPR